MTDLPWFRAEPRPFRVRKGLPPDVGVTLIRGGDRETGNPEVDCWRDTGTEYLLSMEQAVALRASLDAAIEEASRSLATLA